MITLWIDYENIQNKTFNKFFNKPLISPQVEKQYLSFTYFSPKNSHLDFTISYKINNSLPFPG